MKQTRVAVVVVGDLARSPRMVNHARELARSGRPVCLIGLRQRIFTPPPGVEIASLFSWRAIGRWGLPGAAIRMILTSFQLLAVLLQQRPQVVLVQNPPAFPSLLAAWIATCLLRARFIIDWHNYGYSMLAMRLPQNHAIVRLSMYYEAMMARRTAHHFCVSRAMQADLEQRFGVRAMVVYDLPIEHLPSLPSASGLIAVCPAGWTADEDVSLLLTAMNLIPKPQIELHITGDGPLRATLEPRIAALRGAGWDIRTGFLPEEDYRALLSRAHFGISLHGSSSGLDLAMKVVDFFAAGLPILALDYGPTLREQVRAGVNGFVFRTSDELAGLLSRIQQDHSVLDPLRASVRKACGRTWGDEWRSVAAPVLGLGN